MTKNWDEEEAAKDAKTYQTKEGGLRALDYIIKKYMRTREDKKNLNHQNKLLMKF